MSAQQNPEIVFMSAGAGSGKTHQLTNTLHRKLVAKEVRPAGVIATTFTKKAAAELRERVRSYLLEAGDFTLATEMGQARIGTVNSVCGALLQRFCFEAGLAADQQVLEEGAAASLLRHAIDGVLDSRTLADFLVVVRRLGLEDSWSDTLGELVSSARSNDVAPEKLAEFARENAESLLMHFPAPTKDDLDAPILSAVRAALKELTAAASDKKNTGAYIDFLRGFERGLATGGGAWSDWAKAGKAMPEKGLAVHAQPVADIASRHASHPRLHEDLRRYLSDIFDLCARVLEVYGRLKRERGMLDFTDQEHLLLKLLDEPAVADVLREELDLLLVDEFQDTSPIQLALFLKLASFAKSVYWVGDIKQAIYGFRGSDTELMLSVVRALPNLGGRKEILPNSWRSRPPLVALVNAVFKGAFANTLAAAEIELQPKREEILSEPAFANWLLSGGKVEESFHGIAEGIRELTESRYQVAEKDGKRSRDVRYGDIAILSRTHGNVQGIAAALRLAGIPSATAQPGLLNTPEAVLALACLRRLNDSGDTIASAEIISLFDCSEPELWVADRLKHLAVGGNEDLWQEEATASGPPHPVLAKIAGLRHQLPLLAPREALQTVIDQCDVPAAVLRWSVSEDVARTRLANLEALVKLAEDYEERCRSELHAASLAGLILWLDEIAGDKLDFLAEPAIDAVKVMTHHAAKGLEWPVVILTDLAADIKNRLWAVSSQSLSPIDMENPLHDRFIRYWPWPFGKQGKLEITDIIANSSEAEYFREAAVEESKRLLYVSMTRARDLLVFARRKKQPSGEWLDSLGAPWLLPEGDADTIVLPDGTKIPALFRSCEGGLPGSEEDTSSTAPELHGFEVPDECTARLPLAFSPSSSEASEHKVVEEIRLGERLPVTSGTDMSVLGSAIHACIALSFTDKGVPVSEAEVSSLLNAHNVAGAISAAGLQQQIDALHTWISERWPGATGIAEVPVQMQLKNGQVMNGRIDLILDTPDGWVLIDHKSSPLATERWSTLAPLYGGQLEAYAEAIQAATDRPVVGMWLYLPVAAGVIQIGN